MTAAPDSPPQVFAGLEDAVRFLRAAGLRLSSARRLVLETLFSARGPMSAAQLARLLSLDESSVYRNLELFERRGIVRHLHLGHSPGLYLLAREKEDEYLYCERCAKVTAVSPTRLDGIREQVRTLFGLTPRFSHFAIVGVCERCAQAASRAARGDARRPAVGRAARGRRRSAAGESASHSGPRRPGGFLRGSG